MKTENTTSNTKSFAVLLVDGVIAKSAPLTQYIAFLSVCMLTAAFGATVGPTWCQWWVIFGVFGLTAAVGLDVMNRSRARRADHRRNRQLAMTAERKLDEMVGNMASSEAILTALRQLQPDIATTTLQGTNGQTEPRLPLDEPATITPLLRSFGDVGYRRGKPVMGRLRNISRHGFGLAHDQRLEQGFILLEAAGTTGEPIQFVANVLWCEPQDDNRYFSGGKLLEVVSPTDLQTVRVSSK